MQVTIEQGVFREEIQPKKPKGWFAKQPKPVILETRCVNLYVELTEEEKAIFHNFNLKEIVIEEWTPDAEFKHDLKRRMEQALHEKKLHAAAYPYMYNEFELEEDLRKIRERHNEAQVIRDTQKARQITLGRFLVKPHRHFVESDREAAEYIEHLKTDILPKIKAHFQKYPTEPPKSESFDL